METPDRINGAFTVTAAGSEGLTREAGRSSRYVAPSRGVRYPLDHPDPALARVSAAVLGGPSDGLLVDVSAARAWGLPLPPRIGLHPDEKHVVAVTAGTNRPRRRDVRGRRLRLPPAHVTELRAIPVTTPARTWLDCAEHISIGDLIAMGDAILGRSLATSSELSQMITWARRRRGVVNARRALPMLDARSQSPGESLVRAHFVLAGLPRPRCNLDIVEQGVWLARVDLAWPEARVVVEYDGIVHLAESQRRLDALRRNLLQDAGWYVITLTAADLKHPERMIGLVSSALRARMPR